MENTHCARIQGNPRLLDRLRAKIRLEHCSICAEQAYVDWIHHFILFQNKGHSKEMGAPAEAEEFPTQLRTAGRVTASIRNQESSALLFLDREVPEVDVPWMESINPEKRA